MEEFVDDFGAIIQVLVSGIVLICFFVLVARVKAIKKAVKLIALIEVQRGKEEGLFTKMKCPFCDYGILEGIIGEEIDCSHCGRMAIISKVVESGQTDKTDKV